MQRPRHTAAFPDGVVWTTIGRTPGDLVSQMKEVGKALNDESGEYITVDSSRNSLRTALQGKAALLVLDDVWDVQHIKPFLNEEPRCRVLFTTRNGNISSALGAGELLLDVMEPAVAKALLIEWAGREEPEFDEIANRLGYLPLALKIAGARLKEGTSARDWLNTFGRVSQIKLGRYSKDPADNLEVCFDLSIEQLSEADRRFYDALGIFPEDLAVPEDVATWLWRRMDPSLDKVDCTDLLREMERWALIERDDKNQVTLHDLLHDYTRERLGDRLKAANQDLLRAFNPRGKPWHEVPDDGYGYLYRNLAYHLREAGRSDELTTLLLDFNWLRVKLDRAGVAALVADYDVAPSNETLRTLQGALRLSAHIVTNDATQLAAQLTGRLLASQSPEIQEFLREPLKSQTEPWLRPFAPSLPSPGGSLLRTLSGHTEEVNAVAVSSDGRRAVSGSSDQTVKVWDLETGQESHTLSGHSVGVNAVAMSADGRRAVSGSSDQTVKVWDLESGQELHSLSGHKAGVFAVAVSADGRRAVSGSSDQTVKVWDLESGQELHSLSGHKAGVFAVAVSADGRRAVSGSSDYAVKVWDLDSGAEVQSLSGCVRGYFNENLRSLSVAVTGDGRRAVCLFSTRFSSRVAMWDLLESFQEGFDAPDRYGEIVRAVAVSGDGRRALYSLGGPTLQVWDLESGRQLRTLNGHAEAVYAMAMSADGRRAVSGSMDRTVKVWDLESGQELHTPNGHTREVNAVAVSADGRRAVSGSKDQAVKVWDLESGKELPTDCGHSQRVLAVAVSGDGRRTVFVKSYKDPQIWNPGEADELVVGWSGPTVEVRDLESGDLLKTLWNVAAVAVSGDGRRALSVSGDQEVEVWDLETDAEPRALSSHLEDVNAVAMSGDGRRAVFGSKDQTVKVWDLETGAELHTLRGHRAEVLVVALSGDGRRAVFGSKDRTVKVWDLETGAELHTLRGHRAEVLAVAVSADGRRAVSGSKDQTVKMWDLETGAAIATYCAEGVVGGCGLSPDGLTVVAGDGAGLVHFLRLEGVEPTGTPAAPSPP